MKAAAMSLIFTACDMLVKYAFKFYDWPHVSTLFFGELPFPTEEEE